MCHCTEYMRGTRTHGLICDHAAYTMTELLAAVIANNASLLPIEMNTSEKWLVSTGH